MASGNPGISCSSVVSCVTFCFKEAKEAFVDYRLGKLLPWNQGNQSNALCWPNATEVNVSPKFKARRRLSVTKLSEIDQGITNLDDIDEV